MESTRQFCGPSLNQNGMYAYIYIWTSLLIFSELLGESIKELKDSKLAYIQIMSSNKILHPRISSEDFFKQHVDVKLELIPPSCGLSTMYDTHKLQYEVKSPPRDLSEPQWYQNSGVFFFFYRLLPSFYI